MSAQTSAVLTGRRCQCPTCKEVFSTVANFDRHRKGRYGKDRHCVNPADVGMVIRHIANGSIWTMPPKQ